MRRAYQKSSTRASTKSLRRPMGGCCSTPTVDDTAAPMATREVTSQEPSSSVMPQGVGAPRPSSQKSGTKPGGHESPQVGGVSLHERPRVKSAPQKVQPMKDRENLPPLPSQRSRAKSSVAPSSRSPSSPMSAGERPWLVCVPH